MVKGYIPGCIYQNTIKLMYLWFAYIYNLAMLEGEAIIPFFFK